MRNWTGLKKLGWGLAYATIGLATLVAPLAMRYIGVVADPGDVSGMTAFFY